MNIKFKIQPRYFASGTAFIVTSILMYLIVFSPGSSTLLLFIGGMATLMIAWRPVIGLVAYLVVYPLVPAEESLNMLKMVMFALTILLVATWAIQKFIRDRQFYLEPEYRWLLVFFIFLCFSPLLGFSNNFTVIDWARDIAPLLNLLLLPVMVDYLPKKRYRWLVYLVFVPLGLGVLRDILVLLGRYEISFEPVEALKELPFAAIHPSLGLALGLTMYRRKAKGERYWLLLAAMSLVLAFLSPTRTVWITTGSMIAFLALVNVRRGLWMMGFIGVLTVAIGWLIFSSSESSFYVESQKERFEQLRSFREDVSTQNRVEEMKQAGELFMRSPVYGVGFGFDYNFFRPVTTEGGPGVLSTNFTHNDIMFIASKGGVIGLLLFGLMLYRLGKKLWYRMKEKSDHVGSPWATAALLALINSLIIGFSTPVFQTRSAMFALVVLLGMGLAVRNEEKCGTFHNHR